MERFEANTKLARPAVKLRLDDQEALAEALCGAEGNGCERFGRLKQALDDHGRQVESR